MVRHMIWYDMLHYITLHFIVLFITSVDPGLCYRRR